jgi:hypothetical protein
MPKKQKYYEKDFSYIKPTDEQVNWQYVIQKHKKIGQKAHFDIRIYNNEYDHIFSWASKKFPVGQGVDKPILLRRTKDHSKKWLTFEGRFLDKNKKLNKVSIVRKGYLTLDKISPEKGLVFKGDINFELKPFKGKNYIIKETKEK